MNIFYEISTGFEQRMIMPDLRVEQLHLRGVA